MTLATVCLNYADPDVMANEMLLELHHLNGSDWENVTANLDMATNTICGDVSTFSPFVVVEPPLAASSIQRLAAGDTHSAALKNDGTLWAWGVNWYGQLGDGTITAKTTPVQVLGGVQTVAAGSYHTLVVKSDGSLWTWGANWYGQLGDGSNTSRSTPMQVLNGVQAVAAGGSHTLALKNDGTLWAWGLNWYGQLGDGTTTAKTTPVQVLSGVQAVAAGYNHTLALKNDGTLWAWGDNGYGQLGDGTTTSKTTPVQVLNGVQAVAAGGAHTLALKNDGTIWAWGLNWYGQLGDGTTTDRSAPVQVLSGAQAVVGGSYHTLAVKGDGTFWAWGQNWYGQLGDGTESDRWTPTQSLFIAFILDADNDGIPDSSDNCPANINSDQSDIDGDGVGDVCDLDEDNDGAPAAVEAAAPNSGDANNDGVPDSDQDNVASLLSAAWDRYLTVDTITAGGGSVLADVAAVDTTQLPADPQYDLPYDLVSFTVFNPGNPGFSETVRIYFHGVIDLTGYVYRKFDPNTSTWYTLPGVTFGVATIGGNTVAYADLPLTDGGDGDSDLTANGSIVDPGGPALPVCKLTADFDGDQDVDINDYNTFKKNWGWSGVAGLNHTADFDNDGDVDINDYNTFKKNWGRSCW